MSAAQKWRKRGGEATEEALAWGMVGETMSGEAARLKSSRRRRSRRGVKREIGRAHV